MTLLSRLLRIPVSFRVPLMVASIVGFARAVDAEEPVRWLSPAYDADTPWAASLDAE